MARSNARAGPSQLSQTQRTRASRVRIEEEEEEEEEESNENEDDEEEDVAMDVDEDDAGSVRYHLLDKREKVYLIIAWNYRNSLVQLTISFV